jgi:hypothetical protein
MPAIKVPLGVCCARRAAWRSLGLGSGVLRALSLEFPSPFLDQSSLIMITRIRHAS